VEGDSVPLDADSTPVHALGEVADPVVDVAAVPLGDWPVDVWFEAEVADEESEAVPVASAVDTP
jgi:hypothetical protein